MNTNFLQDKIFLDKLDNEKIKQQYVKLTVLTWNEEPIVEIQGKAISGSLNLDGNSSLRRTCNFTMFAEQKQNDLTRINEDLSINRKVKLEIGFKNNIPNFMYDTSDENTKIVTHHIIDYKEKYGEIVWFPLGIFVIFDPSISHQVGTGVTISISLKDKMCLLNGDAGGIIPASVIFSEREDQYGEISKPLIIQIIQQLVNHFGAEDASKIIIEDLDEQIKQVMKYNGANPIYYLENTTGFDTTRQLFLTLGEAEAAAAQVGKTNEDIITYEYGDDIGFIFTDFTYPGELACDPGETVTGVLDKIISVLGNFEYFYDVYGNFHFQEIKNYLNITQTQYILREADGDVAYSVDFTSGKSVYTFEGTKLISAINNAPKYSNIKNDFVVWGVRKDTTGQIEIPVRYHLAIDHKPQPGQQHYVNFYVDDFGVTRAGAQFVFEYATEEDRPETGKAETLYIVGDLNNRRYYRWNIDKNKYYPVTKDDCYVITKDWREQLYYQGVQAQDTGSHYPYYFTQLLNEWPKLYNLKTQTFYDSVKKDPSSIDFWLDMIDDTAAVGQYCVDNIGRRSEVVAEDEINCVFQQQVPDVVFIDITMTDAQIKEQKRRCKATGQDWIQVDENIFSLLSIGGWQNSCYQRICELLYQHTNMNESISITAIPIYYLQPNTRITVRDDASGINGDFMISQISLPLDVSSQMSINAYKALSKI